MDRKSRERQAPSKSINFKVTRSLLSYPARDFSFIEFSKPDGVIFLKGSGDPVNW